jgi:peptidyl-tRNA hydrolase, PTH1 family
VVDHLADVWHFDPWKKDGDALVASGTVGPFKTRLVKPLTYMNLSGSVLKPYLRKAFWSPVTDLLVVVDEVQLPLGKVRLRADGSAGGHNGLKSIEHAVGSREYARMRIGIAPLHEGERDNDLADFVLGPFGRAEKAAIVERMPDYQAAIETWLREGIGPAMNKYNA